jgi:hypothetical protein
MSLTAGDILDLASELLGDQAKILHPDALLLEFLNDGQRAIVSTVPEAGARAAVAHLESGIYQVFPSAGQRLLDMPRNVTPSILAIAATDASKAEGNSGTTNFTFTVTRTGVLTGTCSADWVVTGGGANPANAADFVGAALPSGTVSFTDGESSKVITVQVQGDSTVENDEGFTVTLSNPSNCFISTATSSGTIQNDDAQLDIAATDASKSEGNSGTTNFTFTVTRSGNTSGTSSAAWAVTGTGTNPASASDFVGGAFPSGTVSFSAGETTQVITVQVQGDTTVEQDETFTVTLSSPAGAVLGTATAIGTILNDEAVIWDTATSSASFTFSNGFLSIQINPTGNNNRNAFANTPKSSGIWCIEVLLDEIVPPGGNVYRYFGLTPAGYGNDTADQIGKTATSWGFRFTPTGGLTAQKFNNNSGSSYGSNSPTGTVLGLRWDADTGSLEFFKDGVSMGVPWASGVTGTLYPSIGLAVTNVGIGAYDRATLRPRSSDMAYFANYTASAWGT